MTRGAEPAAPTGEPARTNWGTVVAFLVLGTVFVGVPRASSQAAPPTPDLKFIAESYREQERALRSLFVEYHHVGRVMATAEEALEHLGPIAMKTEETRAFAFKGAKRYSRFARTDSLADDLVMLELAQKESDGAPRTIRVAANSIRAFDGRTIRARNPGGTTASIIAPKAVEREDDYFDSEYLSSILRAPPDAFNPGNDRATRRLASLIESGACVVRPMPETVDGASCVVIEVRRESSLTLWCDPAIGYAARRLEGYFDFGAGPRPSRTTCGGFVNVCANLWLPGKVKTMIFADPAARESNLAPLVTWTSDILDIHANDVADELFALTIPEGTYVLDYMKGRRDLHGRRYATQYYMPADDPDRANESTKIQARLARGRGLDIALACGLVVLVVLGGFAMRHLLRRKSPIDSPGASTSIRRPARLPYHDD